MPLIRRAISKSHMPLWAAATLVISVAASGAVPAASVTESRGGDLTIQLDTVAAAEDLYLMPGGPHVSLEIELDAEDIAIDGGLIYAAAGADGLFVFARQEDEPPRRIAHLPLPEPVTGIRLRADAAWLTGPRGLYRIDIAEPADPRLIGRYPTPSAPIDLALADSRAYLLIDGELATLDVSLAGDPILLGRRGLAFDAHALAVEGDRVHIAAGELGLITYDAHDPLPHSTGFRARGPVFDVQYADDRLYLAAGANGITVLEPGDGGELNWLGHLRRLAPVQRLSIEGERALAQVAGQGLYLLDIANPASMSVISRLPARDCCHAFEAVGDTAFALTAGRLIGFDLAAPPPRFSNEGLAFGQGVNFGGQRRVFIDNDIAYVADWFSGLHLYDLSDPRSPLLLSSFQTGGSAKGVVVRDGHAFVADDDHGLQILDVRDPRRPARVARLATPGLAYTPVLDGDLLYLAAHHGGIVIIDVSDVTDPRLVTHHESPGKAWSIRVEDGLAYVAADDFGLLVLDVTEPTAPQLIGRFDPRGRAEEVIIDGTLAYVAFYDRGVYVLDIANPMAPVVLAHVLTPGNARGLDLHGDHLYIADWVAGMHIADVSDPRRPRLIGRHVTDGAAWGLRVTGNTAFIADWWGGISLLDVTDPRAPERIAVYPRREIIEGITTSGRFAFVAQGDAGLQVFDIANPLNPTWITGIDLAGVTDAVLLGERLHVLHEAGRIAVLDVSQPFQIRLLHVFDPERAVRRLRRAGNRLLLVEERGITLIEPDSAGESRLAVDHDVNDAWADGDRVFIAARDAGVLVVDNAGHDPEVRARHWEHEDIERIRAADGWIYAAIRGGGIRVRSARKDQGTSVHIPLESGIRDLQVSGETLYVATDDAGILVLKHEAPAQWRIHARYPTLHAVTRLTPHRDTLYLAGTDTLGALVQLPEIVIRRDAPNHAHLRLPAGLPAGSYDLVGMQSPSIRVGVQRDVLRVAQPSFGKPVISPEEFRALMEQHARENP